MLRHVCLLMLVLVTGIIFAGCGTSQSAASQEDTSHEIVLGSQSVKASKTLIVYFSWSGNSAEMAKYIQEQTGGDLLALQPLESYPSDYDACVKVAKDEVDGNILPKIANLPNDMTQYDTILVGYPIWWHTAPMIIGTFLSHYDWSGKDIYPFVQSAAMSQEHFDNSMEFVKKYARNANVHDGLYAKSANHAKIQQWLKENNLLQKN